MPEKYLSIKRKAKEEGLSDEEAKAKAAKIYNATRPKGTPPVTRRTHGKKPAR